jgi:hypothetical protein
MARFAVAVETAGRGENEDDCGGPCDLEGRHASTLCMRRAERRATTVHATTAIGAQKENRNRCRTQTSEAASGNPREGSRFMPAIVAEAADPEAARKLRRCPLACSHAIPSTRSHDSLFDARYGRALRRLRHRL